MKRFLLLGMALVFAMQITIGQPVLPGYRQSSVAPELMAAPWSARWISVPGASPDAYGVYHFRKVFELAKCPRHFAVHVSADNRYKLYVNDVLAAQGPSRCDGAHWNYETVDLAPWLRAGRNAVTAVVWNYADLKPAAQITLGGTGFLMQGATERERIVDTDSSWRCIKNDAYTPLAVTGLRGYYVAGPGEMLTAARYPWGWTEPDFDDSNWHTASCGALGRPKGAARSGERQLVPSPVPMSERIPMRFAQVVRAEGVKLPKEFPAKSAVLVVPAHTRAVLLLDQGEETTGYLRLSFSGGHGAVIAAGYAEALYTGAEGYDKGDRNDPTGKLFLGYEDRIVADGGSGRTFEPLWWRTWRYVRLTVETQDEPLSLDDVSGVFSAYPFRLVSRFSAPERPELERMLNVGWRTARLCANETYMDCPYYEQMQYFGDARIQALITLYNTRDTCMVRQLLDLCRQSMLPEGIPQSRYPSDLPQVIPPFAVWWLGTAYDYWMMRGDEAYLQTLLPAFRQVLGWFERYRGADGLLHDVPYWFFIDWPEEFDFGQPRRSADGTSAYQDAVYLLGLGYAAQMERTFGNTAIAAKYEEIGSALRKAFRNAYWDVRRGLFADTHERRVFSQHVNTLAILAGIATDDEARNVMMRVVDEPDLIQATLYFKFYVHRAMAATGLGDRLFEELQPWYDQLAAGLTTWAETPDPTRSDCHAWSASPNVELFRMMLGIESAAPGFRQVRIAPSLGGLKHVSGAIPHPAGEIAVDCRTDSKGRLTAKIALPIGMTGEFVWQGRTFALRAGKQILKIE